MQNTIAMMMLFEGVDLVKEKFRSVKFEKKKLELNTIKNLEEYLEIDAKEDMQSEAYSEVEQIHGSKRNMKKMTKEMSELFANKLNKMTMTYC